MTTVPIPAEGLVKEFHRTEKHVLTALLRERFAAGTGVDGGGTIRTLVFEHLNRYWRFHGCLIGIGLEICVLISNVLYLNFVPVIFLTHSSVLLSLSPGWASTSHLSNGCLHRYGRGSPCPILFPCPYIPCTSRMPSHV